MRLISDKYQLEAGKLFQGFDAAFDLCVEGTLAAGNIHSKNSINGLKPGIENDTPPSHKKGRKIVLLCVLLPEICAGLNWL